MSGVDGSQWDTMYVVRGMREYDGWGVSNPLHVGICLRDKELTGQSSWKKETAFLGLPLQRQELTCIQERKTTWRAYSGKSHELRTSSYFIFQKETLKWNSLQFCIIEHVKASRRTFLCLCLKVLIIPLGYPHTLVVLVYGKQIV